MAKVLIRVDGDGDRGLGHIYRMKALSKALTRIGWHVHICTRRPSLGYDLLAGWGMQAVATTGSGLIPEALLHDYVPDIVVFDTLDNDADTLNSVRHASSAKVVTFDDTRGGLAVADAAINPIVFHWRRYLPSTVKAPLYEGPEFMILSGDVQRYREQTGERLRRDAVLITLGGTDTRELSERALASMDRLRKPIEIRINLGHGRGDAERIRRVAADTPHKITVLEEIPSLTAEIAAARTIVCGGGITLYEAAALGTPAVAIATEDHEIHNIAYWSSVGSALDVGHWASVDEADIASALECLLSDPQALARMSAAGPKALDGRGLDRCLDIVARLIP